MQREIEMNAEEIHRRFILSRLIDSVSMISIPSNWVTLRTKITGLAIIPALVWARS